MSLGGSSYSPATSASDSAAELSREMYSDYLTRFTGIEDELINAISEPIDGGYVSPQPTDAQRSEYDTYRSGFGDDRQKMIDENNERMGYEGGFSPEEDYLRKNPGAMQGYDEWASGMGYPTEGGESGGARLIGNTALTNQFIGDARGIVSGQMDVAGEMMGRNASRYGMPMTGDRKTALDRGMNLGGAMMDVDVANKTRDQIEDFNVRTATELMNTGRGLANDASSLYGSAAQLEAQRNSTNQALSAQGNANMMSGLGTIAGLALKI